jgi:N-acetylneuraminic acid mutarotase
MSMLDLENMRWSELAPLPERRVGMKGAVIGGKIYIAGGSSQGEILNTVDRYDPDTDTWTEAAKLSSDRMGHAAASIGDVLYVIGGSLNIPKSADDIRLSGTIEAVSFAKDGIGG